MLWLSERSGWRHLYLYEREGELRPITSGEWEVDTYHGYDEDTGWIYFSGDRADVKGQQLFRVNIDGTGLEQLTEEPGTHRVTLSPDFTHYVDSFSSHAVPPRLTLHTIDGALVRTLAEVDPRIAEEAGLITPELVQVKTRDGFTMEAKLVKPRDFDPSVRYPVLSQTYAGPHAPSVRDSYYSFNDLFHQLFANEGYLIWVCDNRSASGKGLESVKPVYKNLGPLELRDLEDGIAWLVDQGLADPARVGLWGWSYGGFMTAYALTHSEVFSCGVIGAPVTDWRLYDTIYTERYMDTPQANPEGYDRTSVVQAAEDLHGKALIIHGAIDENVHMQNSLQLANALQDAGHLFELMLYPGNRHGVVQPKQRRHLYAMVADFFRRNL
jgi:dipeptidyl-peptidase-4